MNTQTDLDIDLRKSVFVVDDDEVVRSLLNVILSRIGFMDIREAVDGQKALITLLNTNPVLVITDIDMPIMDGLQLVHQIRRQRKFDYVPILALTANDTKEMVVRALKTGIDSYLIKGKIKEAEVLEKIREAIHFRQQKLAKKGIFKK